MREDGAIITNYHVISNASDIRIKAGEKVLDVEGFLHMDEESDLVILKADAEGLQAVRLGDIEKLNVGEKVYVISSPEGLENTISDGILSGIREVTDGSKVLQITAPISAGSSGGPAFNENGEVVGIVTSLLEETQNINFAMPINLIKDKVSAREVIALREAEVEDYTTTAEYWYWLCYNYLISGLHREASEACKQVLSIETDHAGAYVLLGIAYRKLGMHKEAIEAFNKAINLSPSPDAEALGYYLSTPSYIGLGMLNEALVASTKAIEIKPDNAEYHAQLGGIYALLQRYDEAIDSSMRALRIAPDTAEAYFSLGHVYFFQDRYGEAIEANTRALELDPDNSLAPVAFAVLGNIHNQLEMYGEAIKYLKQAIRIKPDFAKAHFDLGIAYAQLEMYRDAIEAFKQTIRIEPDDAMAHIGVCTAYHGLSKFNKAIESCKTAVRIEPDNAIAHSVLGSSYYFLGDRGSALEEYKILKDLDPQMANELFNLIYE